MGNEVTEWVFVPMDDHLYKSEPIRISGTRQEAKDKIRKMFSKKKFFQYAAFEWDRRTIPHE